MRILQVDLENFKSYQSASIPFTEGTNAICGPNGAGKSTLLEAIGFALFGHAPYTQSQLVPAEFLPSPILLNDQYAIGLHPLIGGEAGATAQALPAPAHSPVYAP